MFHFCFSGLGGGLPPPPLLDQPMTYTRVVQIAKSRGSQDKNQLFPLLWTFPLAMLKLYSSYEFISNCKWFRTRPLSATGSEFFFDSIVFLVKLSRTKILLGITIKNFRLCVCCIRDRSPSL